MITDATIVTDTQPSLLALLLGEQSDLSAVERFSQWHEANSIHASTYQALMPSAPLQLGEQYAFEVDLDACSGCKACVVACHTLNGLEESETWRKVGVLSSQSPVGLSIVQHVTTTCHHCVDPGCLKGCPVKAYEKDTVTGIVKHLDDQCIGCKYCTMMCPYEVPQYSATLGIVRKCDMCSQRLGAGESPACVQACPNQAIRITIVESQLIAAETTKGPTTSILPTSPFSHITKPTTRYKSSLFYSESAKISSFESCRDETHEGHLPLAIMLVLTQASVGMWVIMVLESILVTKASITTSGAIAATALAVVGVHAALFHLGRPHLAFRTFLGWRTSWLSREAIAFGLYIGMSGAAALSIRMIPNPTLVFILSCCAALTGLLAVGCSAMIYVATQRELWSLKRTGLEFGLTTLGLGLLGAVVASVMQGGWVLVIGAIACAATSCFKISDVIQGTSGVTSNLAMRSGKLIAQELSQQWSALWIMNGCALAIALFACVAPTAIVFQWIAACFVCGICLVAQILHRWIFFASVVFRRMPGAST